MALLGDHGGRGIGFRVVVIAAGPRSTGPCRLWPIISAAIERTFGGEQSIAAASPARWCRDYLLGLVGSLMSTGDYGRPDSASRRLLREHVSFSCHPRPSI